MIMAARREYTPTEAAAVSGIGIKSVHNAIDKRIIGGRLANHRGRAITDDDLLRLKLWYGVGSTLSAERRKRLFDAIEKDPGADTVRADDYLIIDVARAREQLAVRADALSEAENLVHRSKDVLGGEPVFKGTRVPVRTIAVMKTQGATTEEIVEGYPSLTAQMVQIAEIWTAAHPARGRPKRLAEQGLRMKASKRIPLSGNGAPNKADTPA
jgi:uncharacterized protein (DUF433 family)